MTPLDIIDVEESSRAVAGMSFRELAEFGGSDFLPEHLAAKVRAARAMMASRERETARPKVPPVPYELDEERAARQKVQRYQQSLPLHPNRDPTAKPVIDSEGNFYPSLNSAASALGGHMTRLKSAINAGREYHGRKVWYARRAPKWAVRLVATKESECPNELGIYEMAT